MFSNNQNNALNENQTADQKKKNENQTGVFTKFMLPETRKINTRNQNYSKNHPFKANPVCFVSFP